MVYTSATASLAVLEVFANISQSELLRVYALISCEFDETLVERLAAADLPRGWHSSPGPPELQAVGDRWLLAARSVVLEVPSAIIDHENNYLLNPSHPDFKLVRRSRPQPFRFDIRLLK